MFTKSEHFLFSKEKDMRGDLLIILEDLFSFRSFMIGSSVLLISSILFAWGVSTL